MTPKELEQTIQNLQRTLKNPPPMFSPQDRRILNLDIAEYQRQLKALLRTTAEDRANGMASDRIAAKDGYNPSR